MPRRFEEPEAAVSVVPLPEEPSLGQRVVPTSEPPADTSDGQEPADSASGWLVAGCIPAADLVTAWMEQLTSPAGSLDR